MSIRPTLLCFSHVASITVKNVPVVVTHDGRTIRYPDPNIHVLDTVKIDLKTNKIVDHIKFDTGVQVRLSLEFYVALVD